MKHPLGLCAGFIALLACAGQPRQLHIEVTNPLDETRSDEIAELPLTALQPLGGDSTATYLLTDEAGDTLPTQVTYDHKLIFPVTLQGGECRSYTLRLGTPAPADTLATGARYPERLDDLAWENDRIAFRAYGPALQRTGERAYGYDVWTKNVPYPVVRKRYARDLDPAARARIATLRRSDPAAAQALADSISYHVDHGEGMDFYAVGPTLGAGTTALFSGDTLAYPYCYDSCRILDNGPLRFTVRLTYKPLRIHTDTAVVESRLISLDAGTHLNRTVINYTGLHAKTQIATGLVMHAPSEEYKSDIGGNYIAYAEAPQADKGRIYVAAILPQDSATRLSGVVPFPEEQQRQVGATGHLLAISHYLPGETYIYHWGAGWSRYGFETPADWYAYVAAISRRLQNPLQIRIR